MLVNQKLRIIVIAILICVAYTLWLIPQKPVQIANLKILDAFSFLSSRFAPTPATLKDIVVITIDDESLREINVQWPWPRSIIASLLKNIAGASPSLICVDLVFAGKSIDPAEDAVLINSIRNAKNVYGAAYFGNDGKYVVPEESIALSLMDFGFVNKPRDVDNTVRRMRPYFLSTSGGIIDYSLSIKTASHIINVPPANLALAVPLSEGGAAYIGFFGKLDRFNSLPAWKILKGEFDVEALKNKAIFVGSTSESFHDMYHTPLGIMPGLLIDINETITYIGRNFFRYASHETNSVILFIFVLIAVFSGLRLSMLSGISLILCEIFVFFILGYFLFVNHIIIDYFGPILLIIVSTVILHGTRYVVLIVENLVLRREAITDGLTGLYLYRYFELQLKRELKSSFYTHRNLALVIYDIDHFKRINDTYGHEFGNIILKTIARNLKIHSRKNNIIARYGGEEFCVIVPGMKREYAIKYAERLRNMISHLEFRTDKNDIVKVTMSAGIVTIEDAVSDNTSDLIKAADSALYVSKNSGRDRISVFDKKRDSAR